VTVTTVVELVRRMRRDAFSRNRNFDAFERANGEAKSALRLWRYLRNLEQALAEHAPRIGSGVSMTVEPRPEGGRRITIEVAEVRMRRVANLSAEEYTLLKEHPDARALLDRMEQQ
jgi:hypothetical protein